MFDFLLTVLLTHFIQGKKERKNLRGEKTDILSESQVFAGSDRLLILLEFC